MELRTYQKIAVAKGVEYLKTQNNAGIISIPTGGGKSHVISGIAHEINDNILILQPTKEILQQNYDKMLMYGFNDIKIYSASFNSKKIGRFTYATIGSIYKKPELFKHFKVILIDEAHLYSPKNIDGMYNKFFRAIGDPHIVGLTATPYRIVNKYTKKGNDLFYTGHLQMLNRIHPFFFKNIIYKIENHELIEQGYLAKPTYVFPDPNFKSEEIKMNSIGNDFDSESLENYTTNPSRLKKVLYSVAKYYNERKYFLIFASSIRQANELSKLLQENSFGNEMVFGHTPAGERDEIINNFKSGKNRIVINVKVLTLGFDFPELDCIILARPTISLALLYQMIGRGFRPHPSKKNFLVVDCTDTIKKLGRPETIIITKEDDGFRDRIETEVGIITNKPLFTFRISDEKKKENLLKKQQDNLVNDLLKIIKNNKYLTT
jgi:DNA repair protein RadD